MPNPQIAIIVGSNRRDSINRKLAQALIKLGAGKFDAKIVRIDDLPVFNQDHDQNPPEQVTRLGDVKLVPGMPVEAFVKTGERTVISYLMKPLSDQINRAFRE